MKHYWKWNRNEHNIFIEQWTSFVNYLKILLSTKNNILLIKPKYCKLYDFACSKKAHLVIIATFAAFFYILIHFMLQNQIRCLLIIYFSLLDVRAVRSTIKSLPSAIIQLEGSNVTVSCVATGVPLPHIRWSRIPGTFNPMYSDTFLVTSLLFTYKSCFIIIINWFVKLRPSSNLPRF